MHAVDETIVAIASAPGAAPRGILRLSGPRALGCAATCFRATEGTSLQSLRVASALEGTLTFAELQIDLPGTAYVWPTQSSYTRQPTVEIHTLGSPPLLDEAVRMLCAAGARLAAPGEFTLRAFLAGRLDLMQAEAVLGVIDAGGERQLNTALRQLAGGLSRPLTALREELLDLLAHLEAGLDFVEEDLDYLAAETLLTHLTGARRAIAQTLDQMRSRSTRSGNRRAVLYGWPNTGKSSLFNALARQQRALVADVPGTTRDYLVARLELAAIDCELIDTPGLELAPDADDPQAAAQQLAAEQRAQADLRVLCLDGSRELNAWEREVLVSLDPHDLVVITKADLPSVQEHPAAVMTSSATGQGLDALREALTLRLSERQVDANVVGSTALRCGESLRLADEALARAAALASEASGEEMVAAELRSALAELGQVVGAVYTDDILDRIFSRFCIGK